MNKQDRDKLRLLQSAMRALADPGDATNLARFFKTGPGEYGEGDRFLGIRVPIARGLARRHDDARLPVLSGLLASPYHEERLLGLLLAVRGFDIGDEARRHGLYAWYLAHTERINNWDLVDLSVYPIVGAWLADRDRKPLYRLARSSSLWERRMAIVATLHFIRANDFTDTLTVAGMLVNDRHDLIHKAVGWMLREVGKRNQAAEESFLRQHCRTMPRTMLRYAIERFPEPLRRSYLANRV